MRPELKPLQPQDTPEYFALIRRNEAYLDFPWVPYATVENLRQYIEGREMYRIFSYEQLVGAVELRYLSENDTKPHIDLCFWLAREYRNRGIMTSILEDILRARTATYSCKAKATNLAAARVCTKVGMSLMYTEGGYSHYGK